MNDTLTAIVSNGMLALGYNYFTLDVTCTRKSLACFSQRPTIGREGGLFISHRVESFCHHHSFSAQPHNTHHERPHCMA